MTVTTITPTDAEIALTLDAAADHIESVGYCKKYLYSVRQAENGLPLDKCEVDIIGAINVAVHGTPRHVGGDPLTWAAEKALNASIDAPSVAAWCDYRGNGKAKAIALLRDTAASLRGEAA
ncbi:hypothetical protein F7R91_14380 [Streptomyces luteolifulvus]|uniref:Uncharacterized protein n=1 Tax=Streptomyces luteolifulvus TaxID=2615112 RepID=A0A6H9V2B2_9ACTN|nr:hypothetical protein [Streptomyces luteolifulvus]KAB1146763.1 hypothetical protein F7R91_14380 [Streptomyces luteolifulvus]